MDSKKKDEIKQDKCQKLSQTPVQQPFQPMSLRKVHNIASLKEKQRKKSYHWTDTENRRYVSFLIKNIDQFLLSSRQKRQSNLYVKMSKAIKTRTNTQCHTHHQKMMAKFQSVNEIITNNKEILEIYARNKSRKKDKNSDQILQRVQLDPLNENQSNAWPNFIYPFFRKNQHDDLLDLMNE